MQGIAYSHYTCDRHLRSIAYSRYTCDRHLRGTTFSRYTCDRHLRGTTFSRYVAGARRQRNRSALDAGRIGRITGDVGWVRGAAREEA